MKCYLLQGEHKADVTYGERTKVFRHLLPTGDFDTPEDSHHVDSLSTMMKIDIC